MDDDDSYDDDDDHMDGDADHENYDDYCQNINYLFKELNYNNFIGFNVNHHLPDQGLVGNNPQVY